MSVTLANGGAADRSPTDFYPTPKEVTTALLDFLQLDESTTIWEPAAGKGHMVSVMENYGHKVTATDLYTYDQSDFLEHEACFADWIITNPPFKVSEQFIRKAAELKPKGFAFLLKSQYWHSSKRRTLFEQIRPTYVLPLTWRPDFLFGAKSSSPTMEVLWTIWEYPFDQSTTFYKPLARPKGS